MRKIFATSTGDKIEISEIALARMLSSKQLYATDKESGGILMGRIIANSKDFVVDDITLPQDHDLRSRFGFKLSRNKHQNIVNKTWEKTNRTTIYLGTWHTHPEPEPHPSSVDIDDWKKRLRNDVYEGAYLFFIIVGQENILGWYGSRNKNRICNLKLIELEDENGK